MPLLVKRCRLKPLLRSHKKTQRWLAETIHVHYQRINEFANDKYEMPLMIAINCARALGVHVEDLYEWREASLSEWHEWIESRRRRKE